MEEDRLEIVGPQRMCGELLVQGSKNAALPMLSGMLLAPGMHILHHCPRITDVDHMLELLTDAGCLVRWEGHMLIVDTRGAVHSVLKGNGAGKMRAGVTLLGSMLGRMQEVEIPYPGGCTIGARPIDLHLDGLEQLGAVFEHRERTLFGYAKKLRGADITLRFPSVGATENILLAAALAEGRSVICGAAREPEIVSLAGFLRKMGAHLKGEGTSVITVEGVERLHAAEYIVPADRIVAGTYLLGAVMTGGEIRLLHLPTEHLGTLPEMLTRLGARVELQDDRDGIAVSMSGQMRPISYLSTAPFPGFPTDLQSALMAALCLASGLSVLEESIFEARFQIVPELRRMGAQIHAESSLAVIEGETELRGAQVEARELRGGAALIMAALAAEGRSEIGGVEFIKRGYEDIRGDLKKLGIVIH